MLASRARRLGSGDPEAAAQEVFKRALENANAQPAVEYYFSDDLPPGIDTPEWPLHQLFAWLHGVLYFVVKEEHRKANHRREVYVRQRKTETSDENNYLEPKDPSPDQLGLLIRKELETIVAECFPTLDREYQAVLKMRVAGLTYGEIARCLGTNENTVATWVSRGVCALARRVRWRTDRLTAGRRSAAGGVTHG